MNSNFSFQHGMKSQSGCGGAAVLIFFALFWSAITSVFLGFLAYRAVRQTQALGYASTPGTITKIDVVQHRGNRTKSNELKLEYRYEVGGKQYTNDRYRYGMANTSDNWAERYKRDHPPGSPVPVYYNPYDPKDAVLATGIEGEDLMMALFLTPFTCVMLGLWWVCWSTFRSSRADLVAGGLPVEDHGGQVVIRVPGISPLAVAMAVLGFAAFIMIFVLGLTSGMRPPMWLALSVWGLLLIAAGIGYAMAAAPRRQGKFKLTIDRMRDRLILPANFGRPDHVELPFDDISGISVYNPVRVRAKESDSKQHVVVHARNQIGSTDNHTVAEFYEPAPAESLADFLRTELARKL